MRVFAVDQSESALQIGALENIYAVLELHLKDDHGRDLCVVPQVVLDAAVGQPVVTRPLRVVEKPGAILAIVVLLLTINRVFPRL